MNISKLCTILPAYKSSLRSYALEDYTSRNFILLNQYDTIGSTTKVSDYRERAPTEIASIECIIIQNCSLLFNVQLTHLYTV